MGSYITCMLTLFSQFETLSRVKPASVRGWLCNINSLCCCFCLMFSDSLAGSVLCLRGHMKRTLQLIEDKYAQRFADCFPFLRYFQHVCNNGFSWPKHTLNRLWVIRPLTLLLSLSVWHDAMHCIKCRTFFSPNYFVSYHPDVLRVAQGKQLPSVRDGIQPGGLFLWEQRQRYLSKSASVWYTSVLAGYFIHAHRLGNERAQVPCPLRRKQPFLPSYTADLNLRKSL